MKISVITCTWNSFGTLRQTVDSVRCQEYRNVEHVFVDGGSNDGTLEFVQSLPGAVVLRDVSGGISRAMNAGAHVASGDVLCHLHSDDYFAHPRVLERVASRFLQQKPAWLFGRILSDLDGAWIAEQYVPPRFSIEKLLAGNFIPHPAVFVRRAVFCDLGGFREDLKYAMDYDLLLRLARQFHPLQLDEILTVFRRHSGSLSTKNRLAAFDEDHLVRLHYAGRWIPALATHWIRYAIRRRRLLAGFRI